MFWWRRRWHKPVIVDLGPRKGHGQPFAKRRAGRMHRTTRLFRVAEKMQIIGDPS